MLFKMDLHILKFLDPTSITFFDTIESSISMIEYSNMYY